MDDDSSSLRPQWYDTTVCYGPKDATVSDLRPPTEWTTFKLDKPINWDGTSNILLQFSYNGSLVKGRKIIKRCFSTSAGNLLRFVFTVTAQD